MKKLLLISIIFILLSCSHIANNKPIQEIGMVIIGYTIELVLERYGTPDFRYSNRSSGDDFLIYGNKSLRIEGGIVLDVRDIH